MDWDVLGTCEGLRLLATKTRIKVSRAKNTWEGKCVSPRPFHRTEGDRQGTDHQAEGEVFGMGIKTGRLSPPIVAFESWETLFGRSQ